MFLTGAEKITLSNCYRLVEDIQADVDNLFHAGVGEEYLERLVRASETSATQALHIKGALVEDLKHILTEVANRPVDGRWRSNYGDTGAVRQPGIQDRILGREALAQNPRYALDRRL